MMTLRYICALCLVFQAFSPILAQNKLSASSRYILSRNDLKNVACQALIQVKPAANAQAFQSAGVHINSKIGTIWSVSFSNTGLDFLKQSPDVEYIEMGSVVRPASKQDSTSRAQTRAVNVQETYSTFGLPPGIDGSGVVVGIVDIGFQPNHPNFLSTDGTRNRVVRLWDQQAKTGTPPDGYDYGALYTTRPTIEAYRDTIDNHATHVTGIAAGSGYGAPKQQGIAPNADIVMVHIKNFNDSIPQGALSDYVIANPAIIDGYDYIFKYADSVGKPAVINLSWGMHTGPHDGTSLFDKAVEDLVGVGKIVVGAAGNDRGRNIHFYHNFSQDTVLTLAAEYFPRQYDESIYCNFWGWPNTQFSVAITVYDSLAQKKTEGSFITTDFDGTAESFLITDDDTVYFQAICEQKSPLNQKPNMLLMAWHKNAANNFIVLKIASEATVLHGWNSGGIKRYTSGGFGTVIRDSVIKSNYAVIKGDDNTIMGENGGTGKKTITVGAYTSAFSWRDVYGVEQPTFGFAGAIIGFSSLGPTVDGRTKPDVCAPGVRVSSSQNKYSHIVGRDADLTYKQVISPGDTQYYAAFSGTSMASPQVTGVVALMLQMNKNLTFEQVRDILHNTARQDSLTGNTPNTEYGWGKVDAVSAIQAVLSKTYVHEVDGSDAFYMLYPNPSNGELNLLCNDREEMTLQYSITDLQGKTLQSGAFTPETATHTQQFNTQSLAAGIYFMQIKSGAALHCIKFAKQ